METKFDFKSSVCTSCEQSEKLLALGLKNMKVTIEIEDALASYQFKDGDDNVVRFEDLSRREQVRILKSFVNGYNLFESALKEKEE